MKNELLCPHGILWQWCKDCKYRSREDVEELALKEDIAIVENLLNWPSRQQ